MAKPYKYYKITNLHNESCSIPSPFSVKYKINEWVYAKPEYFKQGYGLSVFNSFDAVNCFLNHFRMAHIYLWECETEDQVKQLPFRLNCPDATKLHLIMCGKNKPNRYNLYCPFWPPGTKLFRGVKLIKLIKTYP